MTTASPSRFSSLFARSPISCVSPVSFVSLSARFQELGKPFSAWPFLYSGLPVPVYSARRWRSSRVSRLPLCVHAPLVDSGGVLSTRLCVSRTGAFRQNKNVGFPPARTGVSSRTTTIQFSELSHAACTLATPGFTHTLTGYACRFTSDSADHLL